MDPITASAAVVTAVCAIVGAVNAAQELRAKRKERKSDEAPGSKPNTTSGPSIKFDLSLRINYLVAKFGRHFGHRLDDPLVQAVRKLQPELKQLILELVNLKRLELEMDPTTEKANHDIEKRERALCERVDRVKDNMVQVLENFTKRVDATSRPSEEPARPSGRPLKFCKGVILCQTGKADARKLSVQEDDKTQGRWGFVCQYCYLEVADYNAVRFSHDGEPVVYAEMLAASHVMACVSFSNRRAYYKCLACYRNHKDVDFSSASALETHMRSHPGYSFVTNEPEVIEATNAKIRDYIVEPNPDRVFTGSVAEDDTVDNVSPISSPGSTNQDLADNPIRHPPAKPQTFDQDVRAITMLAPAPIHRPVPTSVQQQPATAHVLTQRTELPAAAYDRHDSPVELPDDDSFKTYAAYHGSFPTTPAPQPGQAYHPPSNGGSFPPHAGASSNVNSTGNPNRVYGPSTSSFPPERETVPSRGSAESHHSARTHQSGQQYWDAPTQQSRQPQMNGREVQAVGVNQQPAQQSAQSSDATLRTGKRSMFSGRR